MAESSGRSGLRAIALLLLFLVVAIGVAAWLALRTPEEAPAPKTAAVAVPAASRPAEVAPAKPRPRVEDIHETPKSEPQSFVQPEAIDPNEGRLSLDVEVLAGTGRPAAGATVLLLDPFAQHAEGRPVELGRTKTDDAGHAKFDVAQRTVRVMAWLDAEAGVTEKFRVSPESRTAKVQMSAAVPIRGRVVDPTGAAMPGAAVRFAMTPWFGDAFGIAVEGSSKDDGTFELPPLPTSGFENAARYVAALEARAKGWPMTAVAVTLESLRSGEVVLRLERGGFVRGRLVTAEGTAVANETVRLTDGAATVASDVEGRFEVPLPRAGGTVIVLSAPLASGAFFASNAPTRLVSYGKFDAAKLLGSFRGDQGDVDLGDVVLSTGQPVKGVVVDLEDKPIAGGDVTLWLAGVQVGSTQTDDAGRFQFDHVGDDAHVLIASDPPSENAWSGRRSTRVDDVRGGMSDLRVVITGALTVVVKFLAEADRSPVVVPTVTLRATATGDTPKNYGWSWAGNRIDSVRFEVEHAGTYDVTVELPNYLPATAEGVEISADRELRIEVLFRKKP